MAFINVIKCTYNIWSCSEFIWSKKIKRKNLPSPIRGLAQMTRKMGPADFILWTLIIKWVHN